MLVNQSVNIKYIYIYLFFTFVTYISNIKPDDLVPRLQKIAGELGKIAETALKWWNNLI